MAILQQLMILVIPLLVSNIGGSGCLARELQFRVILPVAEGGFAALFGGIGLWQRFAILSRSLFEGQALWNSTARFHVWPWPYKFAVVSNMPAFFAGSILSFPVVALWPDAPESVQNALSLIFVPLLWYWVGSRLDRRWNVTDKTPWIALLVFTAVSLVGAFIPIGYVSYIPYGFVVWVITALTISRRTHVCSGIPVSNINKKLSRN